MIKLSHRSCLYIVTLVFIFLAFLVFALAFSVPSWFVDGNLIIKGLWLSCNGSDHEFNNCTAVAFGDSSDWFDGVRGCWLGGMFVFLVAVIYGVVENCCAKDFDKDYGITGVLTFLAGTFGSAGVIVMAVYASTTMTFLWGYFLACISSGLALILSIVLFISKNLVTREKQSRNNPTADYVVAHNGANPYSSDYTNQGFSREDVPLSNGVTYHHTPQSGNQYHGGDNGAYPSAPYSTNSLQHNGPGQAPPGAYAGQSGYQPFGYEMNRPNQRMNVAESADLSNGYTTELIQAEHTLSHSQVGKGNAYGRGGDFGRGSDHGRGGDFGRGSDHGRGGDFGRGSDHGRGGDFGRGSDHGRAGDSGMGNDYLNGGRY